jgi:hypothetical protein
VEGLGRLMTPDHQLVIFDEPPLVGPAANVAAWRQYIRGFPDYVIYPRRIVGKDSMVAVLGHTTGSHLGLPDTEESELTLIWLAEVSDGALRMWRLVQDTPERRHEAGLDTI